MCLFFLAGVILLALGGKGGVFRGTRVPGSFEPCFLSRSGLVANFFRGKCVFMALGCNIAWWA